MVKAFVIMLGFMMISLVAQAQVKTDTLKQKNTTPVVKTTSNSDGGALGRFIRGVNKAGKSSAEAANGLNAGAEKFQKNMVKFAQHVEAYAPDSMKTKTDSLKMKKPVVIAPVKPKTKSDSAKRKSVFEGVFKEN
jgi:predicted phage tail protein